MRCVGALILDADGRLLLVKRGRPPGEGLWSLPGGRVEAGESDPEALVREIREETGLDVTPGELAGSVSRPPYEIYDYYATPAGGLLRAGDDAADVRWVPLDELGRLPLTEGLLDFLGGLSGLPR
ncbi:NUDIX hydrolase [Acrocarpospora phusangensis]|nr:NUDIX domain-containing protein [Acrocarpospora phusangensis]